MARCMSGLAYEYILLLHSIRNNDKTRLTPYRHQTDDLEDSLWAQNVLYGTLTFFSGTSKAYN